MLGGMSPQGSSHSHKSTRDLVRAALPLLQGLSLQQGQGQSLQLSMEGMEGGEGESRTVVAPFTAFLPLLKLSTL